MTRLGEGQGWTVLHCSMFRLESREELLPRQILPLLVALFVSTYPASKFTQHHIPLIAGLLAVSIRVYFMRYRLQLLHLSRFALFLRGLPKPAVSTDGETPQMCELLGGLQEHGLAESEEPGDSA